MRGLLRIGATLAAFCLASIVNPAGCTSTGPSKPDFGEAEMLDLLDEVNASMPFELRQSGTAYRLEVTLEQQAGEDEDESAHLQPPAAFANRAHACGSRSFRQSASACFTVSVVPLAARISLFRTETGGVKELVSDRALTGELSVGGEKLTNGQIRLRDPTETTVLELRSKDGKTFQLDRLLAQVNGETLILN